MDSVDGSEKAEVGCEKVEVRSDSFADDAGNEELRRIIHAFIHLELGENDF